MKKKISLFMLCGIILLGVCGCDKKDINGNTKNDLIGTWELQNEEKEIKTEKGSIRKLTDKMVIETLVSPGACAGSGCPQGAYFFSDENDKIQLYDNENLFCFELEDKETLKQFACPSSNMGTGISNFLQTEYNVVYKKIK